MKLFRIKRTIAIVVVLVAVPAVFCPTRAIARQYVCGSNPDSTTNRCDVLPTAKMEADGRSTIVSLRVTGQNKTFRCEKNLCLEELGTMGVSYSIPLDDMPGFCELLLRRPQCSGRWQ